MSLSAAFLYRFLDDVWELLPTEDKMLLETYWRGLLRAGGDLQQKTLEANTSLFMEYVPVFLTDRWCKYVIDDGTADIFSTTDTLTMTGFMPSALTYETVFLHTIAVSNASGNIPYSESIRFFDTAPKRLRYGDLVPMTVSIKFGDIEFTQGRDYIVNEATGEIQATATTRMPDDQLVTVRYGHREYTEDLDYSFDPDGFTVTRISGTAIADGGSIAVSYQYNATPTVPLSGSNGAVLDSLTVFQDPDTHFGAVAPGKTLTVLDGPNAGTYTIDTILTRNAFSIVGAFPEEQEGGARYTIDAFPHAMRIDRSIVSIPLLQDLIDNPGTILVEGIDYCISGGTLAMRRAFPMMTLGPEEDREMRMWGEVTKVDAQTPYRNFGVLIDFFRTNSEEYKAALQGLWFTFWTGSSHGNILTGLHILMGLPFAKRAGTVIDVTSTQISIEDSRGQVLIYTIPAGLAAEVSRGDTVDRFDRLTSGVDVITRNNEPGFVGNRLGRAGISRFLTSEATKGPGDTDETKALTLLENHLFLPQILAEAVTASINVTEFTTFLDNMKPQWTEYLFSFLTEDSETVTVSEDEGDLDIDITLNLTTTVSSNEFNQAVSYGSYLLESTNGRVIGTGSQAAGNFEDLTRDFAAAGIGKGALIRLDEGSFKGLHEVLERISATVLSLDIPDADLVEDTPLDWVAITAEQAMLNHDAPTLGDPNIILDGANYASPTTLNTKTDADFASTMLTDADVQAMLLVDISNTNNEVQAITDSDIANGEIDVAVAPTAPAAQAHEISYSAVERADSIGTVTDAFAI